MLVHNLHDKCPEKKMAYGNKMPDSVIHTDHNLLPYFPELPSSHLCPLMWHWKTDQLQQPFFLVKPRLVVCSCLCVRVWYVMPQQRPESVSCRVGWRAGVMKHSPVDTLGQWSMSSSSIGPSFRLLRAAEPAGQKQAASKPPLLPMMREQHINTSYPLRWGTWFLERWKTGRRVKLPALGQEKGVK